MTASSPNLSAPPDRKKSLNPRTVFFAAWGLLALLSTLWALATPIAGSPDEPAHMVKAASVVRGELTGPWTPEGNIVQVPGYVAETHHLTCFAFDPEITAGCQFDLPGDPGEIIESKTTAGLYNPVYYAVVGLPTLVFNDVQGLYVMRILSAILSTLFVAMSLAMVVRWRVARSSIIAIMLGITPMVIFLSASVNPNAIEATAIMTVFIGVITFLREPPGGRSMTATALLVAAGGIVSVNARGLSPLWLLLAVVIPCFFVPWKTLVATLKRREVIWSIVAVGVGTAFAVAWLLGSNSLTAAVDDPGAVPVFPGTGLPWYTGFYTVLEGTFGYALGLVGLFGWMDTFAPPALVVIWSAFIGGLLIVGFVVAKHTALRMLLITFAAFILAPPVIQGAYITSGGYIWQGRYNLPLFLCLLVALGIAVAPALTKLPRVETVRLVSIVTALWGVAHLYCFVYVLKRFTAGEKAMWGDFFFRSEWSPPGGKILIVVAFAVLIALTSFWFAKTVLRADSAALFDEATQAFEGTVSRRVSETTTRATQASA